MYRMLFIKCALIILIVNLSQAKIIPKHVTSRIHHTRDHMDSAINSDTKSELYARAIKDEFISEQNEPEILNPLDEPKSQEEFKEVLGSSGLLSNSESAEESYQTKIRSPDQSEKTLDYLSKAANPGGFEEFRGEIKNKIDEIKTKVDSGIKETIEKIDTTVWPSNTERNPEKLKNDFVSENLKEDTPYKVWTYDSNGSNNREIKSNVSPISSVINNHKGFTTNGKNIAQVHLPADNFAGLKSAMDAFKISLRESYLLNKQRSFPKNSGNEESYVSSSLFKVSPNKQNNYKIDSPDKGTKISGKSNLVDDIRKVSSDVAHKIKDTVDSGKEKVIEYFNTPKASKNAEYYPSFGFQHYSLQPQSGYHNDHNSYNPSYPNSGSSANQFFRGGWKRETVEEVTSEKSDETGTMKGDLTRKPRQLLIPLGIQPSNIVNQALGMAHGIVNNDASQIAQSSVNFGGAIGNSYDINNLGLQQPNSIANQALGMSHGIVNNNPFQIAQSSIDLGGLLGNGYSSSPLGIQQPSNIANQALGISHGIVNNNPFQIAQSSIDLGGLVGNGYSNSPLGIPQPSGIANQALGMAHGIMSNNPASIVQSSVNLGSAIGSNYSKRNAVNITASELQQHENPAATPTDLTRSPRQSFIPLILQQPGNILNEVFGLAQGMNPAGILQASSLIYPVIGMAQGIMNGEPSQIARSSIDFGSIVGNNYGLNPVGMQQQSNVPNPALGIVQGILNADPTRIAQNSVNLGGSVGNSYGIGSFGIPQSAGVVNQALGMAQGVSNSDFSQIARSSLGLGSTLGNPYGSYPHDNQNFGSIANQALGMAHGIMSQDPRAILQSSVGLGSSLGSKYGKRDVAKKSTNELKDDGTAANADSVRNYRQSLIFSSLIRGIQNPANLANQALGLVHGIVSGSPVQIAHSSVSLGGAVAAPQNITMEARNSQQLDSKNYSSAIHTATKLTNDTKQKIKHEESISASASELAGGIMRSLNFDKLDGQLTKSSIDFANKIARMAANPASAGNIQTIDSSNPYMTSLGPLISMTGKIVSIANQGNGPILQSALNPTNWYLPHSDVKDAVLLESIWNPAVKMYSDVTSFKNFLDSKKLPKTFTL